jgi:uncharacterized membrane protein
MSLQSWLLYLHILGTVVWIGGGVMLFLTALRVRQSTSWDVVADFAKSLRYLGLRAFMPSVVVVLATGLLMVLEEPVWRISQPWILIGLTFFFIAFVIGAAYLSQIGTALERSVTEPDHDVSKATALIGRWTIGYSAILIVLVAAVWDMVFKPIW